MLPVQWRALSCTTIVRGFPYDQIKDGFKWHEPTTTGLLAHQFNTPGVYYYTDKDFSYAAAYMGTIIVKPKQTQHIVRLRPTQYTPGGFLNATRCQYTEPTSTFTVDPISFYRRLTYLSTCQFLEKIDDKTYFIETP